MFCFTSVQCQHGLCGCILRGNEAYNGTDGSSSIYQTNVESRVIVCNKGRKRSEGRRVEAASRKLMTALASVTPIQGIIDRGTQPMRRAQSRFTYTCTTYPVATRAFGSCNPRATLGFSFGPRLAAALRHLPAPQSGSEPLLRRCSSFFPHQLLASGQNNMK